MLIFLLVIIKTYYYIHFKKVNYFKTNLNLIQSLVNFKYYYNLYHFINIFKIYFKKYHYNYLNPMVLSFYLNLFNLFNIEN